jgi:cell growth-regulating nucleolar protein
MVFFNCGTCGQGLKKNQIEKHLFSCKTNFFSCIDCGSDFKNNEYVNHNKCISEAKKYESKSYVEKATKGELKQNAWFEVSKNHSEIFSFVFSLNLYLT